MSSINFENIISTVFSEVDKDLIPYLASILEENQSSTVDEITDAMFPILSGYDVVPESEIAERCKTVYNILMESTPKKKYFIMNLF